MKQDIENIIKKNIESSLVGEHYLIDPSLIADEVLKAVVEIKKENQRLKDALDWIAIIANEKSGHLGRPRSSDTTCIFCMAYLALNDGAYGEHINYKELSDNKRKEWADKKRLLTNSSTLEGEQSEHLSPNKENK